MDGLLLKGDDTLSLQDLTEEGAEQRGDRFRVALHASARGEVRIGNLKILFQLIPPPQVVPRPTLPLSLRPSLYTAEVIDGNRVRGTTAVELYDATPAATPETPRLINLSAQGTAGAGDGTLIAGFTITGDGSVKLLVRAVGPSLTQFAVNGPLENPHLALYRSATLISANDDWTSEDAAAIIDAQREAQRLGVQDYLNKPLDFDELLQRVATALTP